ncbi:hypothetical protein NQ318_019290 [Aromia moschata]|uniref:Transposase Tc1-like domain-containing protein n=1 Tax=Aromia moschata TaxID=1265417 RepID=A0AAV8YY63_9CUCU|nr:hypothetical protein NQ318_019290 [Aromia moschata]
MQNIHITQSPNPQLVRLSPKLEKLVMLKIYQNQDVQKLPKIKRLTFMEENPPNTSTLVASENEVSQTTVLRILRKQNYHPYKCLCKNSTKTTPTDDCN